ncbi:hypothetical protein BDZ91DRAFT_737138 [Kalaharituber pfeilii]|nr:hypothetical protein BDZ91DRAFT_737138 [Kalaharituber pfeilii]
MTHKEQESKLQAKVRTDSALLPSSLNLQRDPLQSLFPHSTYAKVAILLLTKSMVTIKKLADFRLEAGGLIALADLTTIAERTAIMGTASWRTPPTAALTTGYVFRVENQATVGFLQRVGKPGHLVNVYVEPVNENALLGTGPLAAIVYLISPLLTITVEVIMAVYKEWWTFGIIGVLIFARAVNVFIIKRRCEADWKGAREPGVQGDLLILLSQDRWVRMQGFVDDLKMVTSGQWLRSMDTGESFATAGSTLLVYLTAAFSANATTIGNLTLMGLLFVEVGLLGISNKLVRSQRMYNQKIRVRGEPKRYHRRLDLANELIAECDGRRDWAVGLGLVKPEVGEQASKVVL